LSPRIIVLVVVLVTAAFAFLFLAPVVPFQQLQYVQVPDNAGLCISPSSSQCSILGYKQISVRSYGSFAFDAFGIGTSPFASPVRVTVNGITNVFVFNSTGFVVEELAFPSFVKSEPLPLISVGTVKTLTLPFGGTGLSVEVINNGANETAELSVSSSGGYASVQTINAGQSATFNITSWTGPLPKPGDSLRLSIYGSVCYGQVCLFYENNVVSKVEADLGNTGPPTSIAGGTPGSVWLVGAMSTDASALPNTGVRSTFQVINMPTTGSLAFWVSDGLSNNVWGQVGYFISEGGAPVAFYQIWNLTTDTVLASATTTIETGNHTFSMDVQNGTTWAYAIDGNVFGTYDMGASLSSLTYPVYTVSEEQGNATFSFPAVNFDSVMQVLRSGSWNPVLRAVSYGNSWGIEGNLQTNKLGANQMIVGGTLAQIPQGTVLWSAKPGSLPSSSLIYLSVSGYCSAQGKYAPCWDGNAYVFSCAAGAESSRDAHCM